MQVNEASEGVLQGVGDVMVSVKRPVCDVLKCVCGPMYGWPEDGKYRVVSAVTVPSVDAHLAILRFCKWCSSVKVLIHILIHFFVCLDSSSLNCNNFLVVLHSEEPSIRDTQLIR